MNIGGAETLSGNALRANVARSTVRRFRHSAGSMFIAALLLTGCGGSPATNSVDAGNDAADDTETAVAVSVPTLPPIEPCGSAAKMTNRDYAVDEEADPKVLAAPSANAATLPWALGDEVIPFQIDSSVAVREQCRSKGWSMIQVISSSDLRRFHGWVPSTSLRAVPVNKDGKRIYTTADIEWPDNTRPYRSQVVTIINKIMRDDERCGAMATGSLVVDWSAGTPKFSIPCDGPQEMASIDFIPADATNGRSFKQTLRQGPMPTEPIAKRDAIPICEDAIRAKLSQPKSAEFHDFADTTFGTDGARARLTIGMTAKNGLGIAVDQTAECVFEGEELTSAAVIPSAQ